MSAGHTGRIRTPPPNPTLPARSVALSRPGGAADSMARPVGAALRSEAKEGAQAGRRPRYRARIVRPPPMRAERMGGGKGGGFPSLLGASVRIPMLIATLAARPRMARLGRNGLPARFARDMSRIPPRSKFSTRFVIDQRSLPASSRRRISSNCSARIRASSQIS